MKASYISVCICEGFKKVRVDVCCNLFDCSLRSLDEEDKLQQDCEHVYNIQRVDLRQQ